MLVLVSSSARSLAARLVPSLARQSAPSLATRCTTRPRRSTTLSGSLDESRSDVAFWRAIFAPLTATSIRSAQSCEHFQEIDRPQLVSLMQAGIAMDLLFRTDEYVLADTTGGRLAELASAVAQMRDIRVQLDGFADERGDSDYNLELSEKRVEFVREQLVAAGINPHNSSFCTRRGAGPGRIGRQLCARAPREPEDFHRRGHRSLSPFASCAATDFPATLLESPDCRPFGAGFFVRYSPAHELTNLANKHCKPCEGGVEPLSPTRFRS